MTNYTAYVFYPHGRPLGGEFRLLTLGNAINIAKTNTYSIEEVDVEASSHVEALTLVVEKLDKSYEKGYDYIYLEESQPVMKIWSVK